MPPVVCVKYLDLLDDFQITPVLVFDGSPLPGKSDENERRKRTREEQIKRAEELERTGKMSQARKAKAQSAHISFSEIVGLIKVCKERGIEYVVSPYEADAQISHLLDYNLVDFAISEDSDLLAYGCAKVLFKLSSSGTADLIDLSVILEKLKMNHSTFLDMCIVAGCDYLKNVHGIGIKKAKGIVGDEHFLEKLASLPNAEANYSDCFLTAQCIFKHQTVFHVLENSLKPLHPWPTDGTSDQHLQACGQYLFLLLIFINSIPAVNQAVGNIDPNDRDGQCNLYPVSTKESPLVSRRIQAEEISESTGNITPSVYIHILSIDSRQFAWKIPSFPVLSVNFLRADIMVNGKKMNGLLKQDTLQLLGKNYPVTVNCSSSCNITIAEEDFFVVWEFSNIDETCAHDINYDSEEEDEEEDNEEIENEYQEYDPQAEEITHTLPFKVMGVAYNTAYQNHLEAAKEAGPAFVSAKIESETENPYDCNAIAVFINYGSAWEKIGYIAKELTRYIHPLLDNGKIVSVRVQHVTFRMSYLKVGYYIAIEITRKGQWEQKVLRASQKVK
ncbi:Rad2 nuclease [Desmophyllum pertusum]|uniref:Rad2 nuclease n=1 Tax=Desmophyllum pertusum TaxID=174260 RepID=A0A9W9Y8R1_9CNID|nr:Rad2 nuclease [Desmophyllum pertusum]